MSSAPGRDAAPDGFPATGGAASTGGPAAASGSPASVGSTDRAVQVVGWVFVVLAALMVPWTVYLSLTLPRHHFAAHYDLAWGGFDAAMLVSLAATAWSALRLHTTLPPLAAVTGTLLLIDAWFDVVMSPTIDERWVALAMAVLVEMPLAAVCLWLSVTGHQVVVRRLRRARLRRPGLRPRS